MAQKWKLAVTGPLIVSVLLSGCGRGLISSGFSPTASTSSSSINADAAVPGSSSPVSTPVPTSSGSSSNSGSSSGLQICSALNFQNIVWPLAVSGLDQTAMALSMNITGSYEGESGWNTISGNSDGQGLSLGLLQQNLGQGTLQPLLLQMKVQNPTLWASFFTTADLASINAMLQAWQSATGYVVSPASSAVSAQQVLVQQVSPGSSSSMSSLFPDNEQLSPLDQPVVNSSAMSEAQVSVKAAAASATQASVNWAVANILQSTSVLVPRWKTEFQNLANSAPYRSIQVAQSVSLYSKALAYFKAFGFTQLRSVALMYDFVVQDGGFSSSQKAAFESYVSANPNASETSRALQLVTIRVASVLSQYQADVSSRKTTIINGTGVVHGVSRNLPVQYCYTPTLTGF